VRLHARNLTPVVTSDPDATRPVLLCLAGLRVAMTPAEALALANALVDAAERTSGMETEID